MGDDKPYDQKQPVLAKQGFRRFQGSPAHEVENELVPVGRTEIKHRRPRQAKERRH